MRKWFRCQAQDEGKSSEFVTHQGDMVLICQSGQLCFDGDHLCVGDGRGHH